MLLKDPRMAVLLPLWDALLGDDWCRVLVVRHPLETARSLSHRDQMSVQAGLALWEVCSAALLAGLTGKPVHVVDYDAAVSDSGVGTRLVEELSSRLAPELAAQLSSPGRLDPALRRQRAQDGELAEWATAHQCALWEHLSGLGSGLQLLAPPVHLQVATAVATAALRADVDRRTSVVVSAPVPAGVAFMPVERPRASVVVLSWRSAPHLMTCLRTLQHAVRGVQFEVVLALNEPTPELREKITRLVSGTTTVISRSNLGFGGAINAAAARARGDYVVLLNDDTEVHPGWLEALVETADRLPAAGAVGSRMYFPDGSLQEAGSIVWSDGTTQSVGCDLPVGTRQWLWTRQVDYCSGGSLLVRRSTWDRLGGLTTATFPPTTRTSTCAFGSASVVSRFGTKRGARSPTFARPARRPTFGTSLRSATG